MLVDPQPDALLELGDGHLRLNPLAAIEPTVGAGVRVHLAGVRF